MVGKTVITSTITWLIHSITVRVVIVVAMLTCIAYYALALPWLNRAISANYQQQTGHKLQHDPVAVHLFSCDLDVNNLKDSTGLWQAKSINIDLGCWQSLLERSIVINNIRVGQLHTKLHQLDNGKWNFNDIIQHAKKNNASPKNQTTHSGSPVFIKKIVLNNAVISSNIVELDNLLVAVNPLNLTLTNIDLRKAGFSDFSIDAKVNQITELKIAGKINIDSLDGQLDISVMNIPFSWFNSAIKPYVALDIVSGNIDVKNHISITAGVPHQITSTGTLTDLKLRPTSMDQDAVK